jgi:glycosyltransferase involved in cell wall biosynthesis
MKVLFILSRLLGGKTFSNGVVSAVEEMPEIEPSFLFFDGEDWGKYQIPFIYKKLNKFTAAQLARSKFNAVLGNKNLDFDCVFIQSFELAQGFGDIIAKKPTILAHDSTNILGHWLIYNLNKSYPNLFKFLLKSFLTTPFYWPVIRNVDIFMPRTNWCAQSLIKHYHVDKTRIIVTPGSLDLSIWEPNEAIKGKEPLKLLFVGNDFERKGGDFLIQLYTTWLQEDFELVIVSNDKHLPSRGMPDGIKWVNGITHGQLNKLIDIYRSADIFVYPTKKDQLGLVLLEAAAMGLPIVASDVGGISDIVKDGLNGFLMPYDAAEHQWALKIKQLAGNKSLMLSFGKASRELSMKSFSKSVFKTRLAEALGRLDIPNV